MTDPHLDAIVRARLLFAGHPEMRNDNTPVRPCCDLTWADVHAIVEYASHAWMHHEVAL
jgi:hypothetical protein